MQVDDIGVFIGIDVGKSEHWATALDRDGRRIHDRALPSDESRLRDLYKHLAEHGRVLVVVDQPATIGALAVAVAQDMGVTVGYLPGLSMRRIADLSPGNAKTDARDAAVIAQAARTMRSAACRARTSRARFRAAARTSYCCSRQTVRPPRPSPTTARARRRRAAAGWRHWRRPAGSG